MDAGQPVTRIDVSDFAVAGSRLDTESRPLITDLHYSAGYQLLRVGKGTKPAEIPLPIPVLRAFTAATEGHTNGPTLLSAKGAGPTRRRRQPAARLARAPRPAWPVPPTHTPCAGPSAPPG